MPNIIKGLSAPFVMRESDGAAALLEKDGNYALLIKGGKIGKAESSGNTTTAFTFVVQDEDAKGSVLYKAFPVTGVSTFAGKNGEEVEEENLKRLASLCTSAGRDDLVALMATDFDLEFVISQLTSGDVVVYGRVVQKFDDYSQSMKSEPSYFIKKDKYEDSKKSGANFRLTPRATQGAGGKKPAPGSNGATGKPNTKVSDKLAADV